MVRLKRAVFGISGVSIASFVVISGVSALTYQSNTTLEFTFEPVLSLSISNTNLTINSLVPGTVGTSSDVTVTVNTNSVTGYQLSAAVGNDSTYLNTDLVNSHGSTSFTSLPMGANVNSLTDNNTWGYTLDSGTSYSGLPHYSSSIWKTLKQTNDNSGGKTLTFGIGAKASSATVSGAYQNIIQFRVVANPVPNSFDEAFMLANKTRVGNYYAMQDMTSTICADVDAIPATTHLIDTRDYNVYLVAKLSDGRCWMIDNLNLGSENLTTDLTPLNSNLSSTVAASTFNSWRVSALSSTYDTGEFMTISGTDNNLGLKYGTSYNYYVASGGSVSGSGYYSAAEYDICPHGWKLPTGGYSGEFKTLHNQYNSETLLHNSIEDGGASFIYAGSFGESGAVDQDSFGLYWGQTLSSGSMMFRFYTSATETYDSGGLSRTESASIRCIAKNS